MSDTQIMIFKELGQFWNQSPATGNNGFYQLCIIASPVEFSFQAKNGKVAYRLGGGQCDIPEINKREGTLIPREAYIISGE